jgi:N,N'-diacetylchitobiose phosphorylase
VETPDAELNSTLNMWGPFNCLMTYAWSRAASLIYAGERDGLGFRDTVQDMLGVMHTIPEEAGERLELMITGQVSTGGAMPVVRQFDHHPGDEKAPSEEEYRSDDCLMAIQCDPGLCEGDRRLIFLSTRYCRTPTRAKTQSGPHEARDSIQSRALWAHGLPCGLSADWNDCIRLGAAGESTFVAFQLRYALQCLSWDLPDHGCPGGRKLGERGVSEARRLH